MTVQIKERLVALDAFRGMTIALMILVNTPGSWKYVYSPLEHAYFVNGFKDWFGCTPTDLVFPFFLFIVGVAMRFSFKKYDYLINRDLTYKILGRTMTIFILGLALNAFPFIRQDWDYSTLRLLGVLQRIALVYGAASFLCLMLDQKKLWITSGSILIGYWLICWLFGGQDPFSMASYIGRKIDLLILGDGHVWHGVGMPFDPEGLFSTIPAIVTTIIGYEVGRLIQTGKDYHKTIRTMLSWGMAGVLVGWIWGFAFPIAKPIWSSSYVVYTGGWAMLFLALFIWVIDMKGNEKLVHPLVIFGSNSIFVFVASGLWVKTILRTHFTLNGETVNGYTYLYETVFAPLAGNLNGSLLFALAHVAGWWLVLYWLYKKKIYIKI